MTTSDIGKAIEDWCVKNETPISLDVLAQILAQRLSVEIDCGDLREKLDDMIASGMVTEPSHDMFEIGPNWKDF